MMSAGGGDLERALGAFLSLDVAQIEQRRFALMDLRLRARQHLGALEMVGDLDQRIGGDDLKVRARPGRFRSALRRTDQAFVARIGADLSGSTPATGEIDPSGPSSPSTVKPFNASGGIAPI